MAKLKLTANPTFKAKVGIPVAGEKPVEVEMEFKHRTKSALNEFIETRAGKTDLESFLDMVVGWELTDEFNNDSVETLLENYAGAGLATFETYINQLVQARTKNS
jgi:hypothetical protein